MNNKKLGTAFEKEVLDYIAGTGAWVHFITPDERGAQPFDIIAVRNNCGIAIECKTLSEKRRWFSIDRLEQNQIMAFEKWMACGNETPLIFIKYGDDIKVITYSELKEKKKIDMENFYEYCDSE